MKKRISMLAFALMVFSALALAACGGGNSTQDYSDSKYVGTWKITKMELLDESEEFDENWEIVLNGDGTGQSITSEGTEDITWKLTDDGFKTDGAAKLTFTDDGDNVKAKMLGVDLIFEKE